MTKEELLECVASMTHTEKQLLIKMLWELDEGRDLSFLSNITTLGRGTPQYIFQCPQCSHPEVVEMQPMFTCANCGWKESQ